MKIKQTYNTERLKQSAVCGDSIINRTAMGKHKTDVANVRKVVGNKVTRAEAIEILLTKNNRPKSRNS